MDITMRGNMRVMAPRFSAKPQPAKTLSDVEREMKAVTSKVTDTPFFTRTPAPDVTVTELAGKLQRLKQAEPTGQEKGSDIAKRIKRATAQLETAQNTVKQVEAELKIAQEAEANPQAFMDKVYMEHNGTSLTGREILMLIQDEGEKRFPNLITGLDGEKMGWKDFLVPFWPLIKYGKRKMNKNSRTHDPSKSKGVYQIQLMRELPEGVHAQLINSLNELEKAGFLDREYQFIGGDWNSLKACSDSFWVVTESGKKAMTHKNQENLP